MWGMVENLRFSTGDLGFGIWDLPSCCALLSRLRIDVLNIGVRR